MKPVNPITGRHDGIDYTFGGSTVALALSERLLAIPDNKRKFHKVASALSDYIAGLKTLTSLPLKSPMRTELCMTWRQKYLNIFDTLITNEEGRTFLLNLSKTRFKIFMTASK